MKLTSKFTRFLENEVNLNPHRIDADGTPPGRPMQKGIPRGGGMTSARAPLLLTLRDLAINYLELGETDHVRQCTDLLLELDPKDRVGAQEIMSEAAVLAAQAPA